MESEQETRAYFNFTTMGTVLALWFVGYEDKNLMAVAWQETAISRPQWRWRVRYYAEGPGEPFDGRDWASWYDMRPRGEVENLVEKIDIWIGQVREHWPESTILVDAWHGPGTPEDVFHWMGTRRWVQRKRLTPGDPDDEHYVKGRRRRRGER